MPDIGQRVLKDDDKLKVLLVTGHTDIHHDWRTISPMLRDLLTGTGLFDVRITEEFRGASPETLDQYDLVVLKCEWAATGKVTLELPDAFGEPVPGGDWWPTTIEPMVRDMYEQRKAGAS